MEISALTKFRDKLPYRYAKLISENLDGISDWQVRAVFNGNINNPDVVEPVIVEAKALLARMDAIKSDINHVVEQVKES